MLVDDNPMYIYYRELQQPKDMIGAKKNGSIRTVYWVPNLVVLQVVLRFTGKTIKLQNRGD